MGARIAATIRTSTMKAPSLFPRDARTGGWARAGGCWSFKAFPPLVPPPSLSPRHGRPCHLRLDQTVRLFRCHENLVAVLETERRKIDGNVMPVRHSDPDPGDFDVALEDGLAHRVQRVLDRPAVVLRERLEQGLSNRAGEDAKGEIRPGVLP